MAEISPVGPPLPPMGNLAYRAQRFLLTDSKMSEILVVHDEADRELIFKIACVRHRSRAHANRQAIYNSVTWLETVGRHPGIITLHPIQHSENGARGVSAASPLYVAPLTEYPGNPEFIVLDYLQGGTLSNVVRKRPLPFNVTLWLAHRLAVTLAHLHDRGCVHRDLKPENILFATPPREIQALQELQPILIDFGVAAGKGESQFVGGSRLWMAPELQEAYEQKMLPVDPSWDIYALGLIGCYMLSGTRPRRKAYTYEDHLGYQHSAFACCTQGLVEKQLNAPPELDAFKALLCAALAETPTERPNAAGFAEQTAAMLASLGSDVQVLQPVVKPTIWGNEPPKTAPNNTSKAEAEQPPAIHKAALLNLFSLRSAITGLIIVALLVLIPTFIGGRVLSGGATSTESDSSVGESTQIAPVLSNEKSGDRQAAIQPVIAHLSVSPTSPIQSAIVLRNSTPPTLVPTPTIATPSLASERPIPTLALSLVEGKPTHNVPTLAPLPATATVTPTASPIPTKTATRVPTNTPNSPTPLQIRLLAPTTGAIGSETRVTFVWESIGRTPSITECYELVFWDRQNSADKRSPVGAGPDSRRTVNFRALTDSTDPLLRTLTRSNQSFTWGVRIVDCALPQTILQDVDDVRTYHYQP